MSLSVLAGFDLKPVEQWTSIHKSEFRQDVTSSSEIELFSQLAKESFEKVIVQESHL